MPPPSACNRAGCWSTARVRSNQRRTTSRWMPSCRGTLRGCSNHRPPTQCLTRCSTADSFVCSRSGTAPTARSRPGSGGRLDRNRYAEVIARPTGVTPAQETPHHRGRVVHPGVVDRRARALSRHRPGSVGVEPDSPNLVAERRAVHDDPEGDQRRDRDEDPVMQRLQALVTPQDRDDRVRLVQDVVRDRNGFLPRSRVLERAALAEAVAREPERDPVEHDRRDDLVRADSCLEDPGDPRPERSGKRGEDDADDDVEAVRERVSPVGADPDRDDDAHLVYWPWPPMLKRPQRKTNATASPVSANVVVRSRVCVRLNVERSRMSVLPKWSQNQLMPAPSRIPWYASIGLAPDARMTRPPMKNAKTAVRSGGMIPPAFCFSCSRPAVVVGSPCSGGGRSWGAGDSVTPRPRAGRRASRRRSPPP